MESKILLADDDPITLAMHQATLKLSYMDLEVKTFPDGQPLLEYLTNEGDPYTHYIILLDLNMPVIGGLDLLFRLDDLKEKIHQSVMVVSACDNTYDQIKALNFDFVKEYITKPFKIGDLSKVISLVDQHLKQKLSA